MNAEAKVWLAFNGNYLNNLNFQANVDECERAAEIYQCGKEKAPLVTHAVQSGLTNFSPKPKVFLLSFYHVLMFVCARRENIQNN